MQRAVNLLPHNREIFRRLQIVMTSVSHRLPSSRYEFRRELIFQKRFRLNRDRSLVLTVRFVRLGSILSTTRRMANLISSAQFTRLRRFPHFTRQGFLFPLMTTNSQFVKYALSNRGSPFVTSTRPCYPSACATSMSLCSATIYVHL